MNIHNAGDKPCDWELYITPPSSVNITVRNRLSDETFLGGLDIEGLTLQGSDTQIKINSKTNLIEGYAPESAGSTTLLKPSGIVYNKYITQGEFFKLPRGDSYIAVAAPTGSTLGNFNYTFKYF